VDSRQGIDKEEACRRTYLKVYLPEIEKTWGDKEEVVDTLAGPAPSLTARLLTGSHVQTMFDVP